MSRVTVAKRPSRAEVARALRDLQALWRPPDSNDNAGGQADVGKSEQQKTLKSYYTSNVVAMRGGLR